MMYRHSDLNVYAKPLLVKHIAAKGKLNMLDFNNNLSMGDIFPLITTPYEAIPHCYAPASIISNSSNGMLNPRAEFFSVSTPLNITLNYHANMFSSDTIPAACVQSKCLNFRSSL